MRHVGSAVVLSMCFISMASGLAIVSVPITSGSAVIDQGLGGGFGQFSLFGPGVSFTGAAETGPISQCPCTSGGTFGVNTGFSSEAPLGLTGTVTIEGVTISYVCFTASACGGGIDLTYTMTLPNVDPVPPSTLVVEAPFTATAGFLTGPNVPPGGDFLQMSGQGTATVDLTLLVSGFVLGPGAPSEYYIQSEQFAFSTIPEPGTAALTLAAFAAIIALRRYSPIF